MISTLLDIEQTRRGCPSLLCYTRRPTVDFLGTFSSSSLEDVLHDLKSTRHASDILIEIGFIIALDPEYIKDPLDAEVNVTEPVFLDHLPYPRRRLRRYLGLTAPA